MVFAAQVVVRVWDVMGTLWFVQILSDGNLLTGLNGRVCHVNVAQTNP